MLNQLKQLVVEQPTDGQLGTAAAAAAGGGGGEEEDDDEIEVTAELSIDQVCVGVGVGKGGRGDVAGCEKERRGCL